MTARRLLLVLLAVGALAGSLTGCGEEPVTVGEGRIPGPVPDDFPIPAGAVVGATLIDRVNHRTEFELEVASPLSSVVRSFTLGLVSRGFVVVGSAGDGARWEIEFGRDTLRGVIVVEADGPEAARARVSINQA